MKRIAIIGAGVSGMTVAQLLSERNAIAKDSEQMKAVVFEKMHTPGGLIRCERLNGSLFHTCGGHIFNTHDAKVKEWFWHHFNREEEFVKTDRNAVIFLPDGQRVPYPIENYVYLLKEPLQRAFIHDMLQGGNVSAADNFEDFLLQRFGATLYQLYFGPFNRKVWQCRLKNVPLAWLEGKLPMPTREEIIYNNLNRTAEKISVHSTFYYERQGGSQFIADRLAEGLDIRYDTDVKNIRHIGCQWLVDDEPFDAVVFCGNIKDLPAMLQGVDMSAYSDSIDALSYHGTTTVFCVLDENPYTWIYLPDETYRPHRIICTGNFSPSNNSEQITGSNEHGFTHRISATIEFTDHVNKDEIVENLTHIPLHPTYIAHRYNKYTYPIQDKNTRQMIASLKEQLSEKGLFLCGRFADWEYYNMDAAMAAAMKTVEHL